MKKVLVLGASGYIGSQLLPILVCRGYQVTGAARQLDYLKARVEPAPNLSLVYLDLANTDETQRLIAQHDLVFFLVHGMAHGHDFIDYELSLAINVKNALNHSHVEHLIYLSAIQPQTADSEHLKARRETGAILRQSKVPITELRAGVIIGPGSAAYEIMRDFVMNLPILVTPDSVDSKANPIALENLNFYLMAVLQEQTTESIIYEVGGPDSISYREQFKVICESNHRPFRIWSTPLLSPKMASYWLSIITSVPSAVGRALLAGLEHDFIAKDQAIHEL